MDKRTLLAVILAAVVLFGYQFYVAKRYPNMHTADTQYDNLQDEKIAGPVQEYALPEEKSKSVQPQKEERVSPPQEVTIETEKYVVTLSNEGGCIKSIAMKEYPDPRTNEILRLADISDAEEGIFNISGLGEYDLLKRRFAARATDKEVIFSTQLANGLEIEKKYIFNNSFYHIELELFINNTTSRAINTEYTVVAGSNIDIATKLDRRYTQIVSEVAGKPRRDNGGKGEGQLVEGVVSYAGLQNKYFSIITKPSAQASSVNLKQTKTDNLLSELKMSRFKINAKSGVFHNFLLYVGPTKKDIMEAYNLKSAVSYGVFGGISEILLAGLTLFRRIFKNWGVAIILLASVVNIMLLPLSRKSYLSMKKMQALQPHMEKLRSEHKDNPHKLNKEMMELYKKYNVNPMGGCLPMLLQLPIFVALYQALMRSLDLRGANFLWIKDLSMPDAVPIPFTLPAIGSSINILPILMAAAMVVQQKISTMKGKAESAQAKQQQQMMVIMPVLFLFIMYNFPSGLVLYWLTNTILTMLEQRAIMRT